MYASVKAAIITILELYMKSAVAAALEPYSKVLDKTPINDAVIKIPMFNKKTGLGDNETKAFAFWIKTGDDSGIQHLKASNNNPMNETTGSQGGFVVPTGHYNQVVAKMRESALYPVLNVRMIPGQGKTVNVPTEGARDGAFILTTEGTANDRDAPILAQVPMTLDKYTKRVELSDELMYDEASNLITFIATWGGEGMEKKHNALLVTAALANGTLGAAW